MSRWEPCRYCDAPAEWAGVCQDCRRETRLPSKVRRTPEPQPTTPQDNLTT